MVYSRKRRIFRKSKYYKKKSYTSFKKRRFTKSRSRFRSKSKKRVFKKSIRKFRSMLNAVAEKKVYPTYKVSARYYHDHPIISYTADLPTEYFANNMNYTPKTAILYFPFCLDACHLS